GSVGGDGGILLCARRVRVHWEFRPQRATTAVVALAEDAGARTVLSRAVPHHDEVPCPVAGDRGNPLVAGGVGVHLKLGPGGRAGGGLVLKTRPKTPSTWPSCPLLHATTKSPAPLAPTAG